MASFDKPSFYMHSDNEKEIPLLFPSQVHTQWKAFWLTPGELFDLDLCFLGSNEINTNTIKYPKALAELVTDKRYK